MSRLLERSSVTLASRYERPRLQISTDAAYFYGRCTCRDLRLSVCLSVCHTVDPYKNGRTDRETILTADW